MQSPAVQFVPSLVTEDDDEVEEDNVDDKKEVGDAEKSFIWVVVAAAQWTEQANKDLKEAIVLPSSVWVDKETLIDWFYMIFTLLNTHVYSHSSQITYYNAMMVSPWL